jgi:hydroxymethylbilane synthase
MISALPLLKIGTRGSPLALAQAHETKRRLAAAHPELSDDAAVEIVVISTLGDRVSGPLTEIGGKGLFTKELEEALQSGAIDLAVHSMKDMPTWLPDGLKIVAMLPREDPRDLLLVDRARLGAVTRIADLPQGAVVGSSALRRQAQLLFYRPDLKVVGLRGNVGTRMRKLSEGQFDMTLLALAGINRLGIDASVGTPLGHDEMLPAVAQGAIGLEINMRNQAATRFVQALDHSDTHRCVAAERAMLAVLDGSCRTPIAGYARLGAGGMMTIEGLVAKPDGSVLHRQTIDGAASDSVALGVELGQMLKQQAGDGFL